MKPLERANRKTRAAGRLGMIFPLSLGSVLVALWQVCLVHPRQNQVQILCGDWPVLP